MTANRTFVLPCILAALAGIAGCATRVRDAESAPEFAAVLMSSPAVGLATVTVDPLVEGILTAEDQTDADDALYGAFVAAAPGVRTWHPSTVRDLVGAEALVALAAEYTRYGRLRADQLRSLAQPLEDCRFLAFGRLLEDRVRTLAQEQTSSDPGARAEGQGEHDSPWTSIVSVERQVRVAVEIFDLVGGKTVWRAEATSRERQLYDYSSVLEPDLKERLAEAGGPVYLSRHGDALKLPDLITVMRNGFTGLLDKLPQPGS